MISLFFAFEFSVIKPDYGLIFWTTIIFLTVWYVLGKKAFPAIHTALKNREESIADALAAADRAREEMTKLQSRNEELLAEARTERANILRDAKEARETMIKEAQGKAREEAQRILQSATQEIEKQKHAATQELTAHAGALALDIAEKVIRRELKGDSEQQAYVKTLVDELKLN